MESRAHGHSSTSDQLPKFSRKAPDTTPGIFGKWHLGDNFPCRPQDQGFDETFYHGGGGVTQTPDYFGNDYFDDTYFRNGVPEKTAGYCTDVWFSDALRFIEKNAKANDPFFVYLSTNAPHGPFLVDEKYSEPYKKQGVPGRMAAFYGMITNIDENMGRLMEALDRLEIAKETILIFTTDNGTAAGAPGRRRPNDKEAWRGFNDGMRGTKGSEYDGGHRVPFFIRWPGGKIAGGRDVDTLAAHIDVLPTLADLCGVALGDGPSIDGKILAAVLRDAKAPWPDRTLFVHSQRLENPVKWRKSAVMTKAYRLVNGKELYDLRTDPGQSQNVAAKHREVVKTLTAAYEGWWKSLTPVFDDHVRIGLGNQAESPARLTCHDWHTDGGPVPWNQGAIKRGPFANGYWAVHVERAGTYRVTLRRWPEWVAKPLDATKAQVRLGGVEKKEDIADSAATAVTFELPLEKGDARLETTLTTADGKSRGAYFVDVEYVGEASK